MRACPHCKTPYTTAIEFCGIDGTRLLESDADPLVGAVIDRYRVVERIGDGGMAAVYRAVHTVIDRQCALKVLFGELASDKSFAQRFRHEAQTASRIKHDNVVEVLDFGTTPEGASFLLMELLQGKTLGVAIQEVGTIEPKRAAWIAREIAAGLAAAHAIGFVHRDLKPANIMLIQENGVERAKILDFGLVSSKKEDGAHLTHTGQTLGTPYYMAPEQIEGATVTPRTDIYALGVIVHEMLSGARPFVGSLSEILLKHASEPPPPLPPSGGLEELVDWMLEKSPSRRPASAVVVVREIEKLALLPEHAPNLVLPAPPVEAPASPETRADRAPVVRSEPRSEARSEPRAEAHFGGPALPTFEGGNASDRSNSGNGASSSLFPPSASLSDALQESNARTETALALPVATPPPIAPHEKVAQTAQVAPAPLKETRTDNVVPLEPVARAPVSRETVLREQSRESVPHQGPPSAASGVPLPVVAVAVIVAVALLVFGIDRVRAFFQPLQGTVEQVGERAGALGDEVGDKLGDKVDEQAKNVAASLAPDVVAPTSSQPQPVAPTAIETKPAAPDATVIKRLDDELAAAFRKRGLSRADLASLSGMSSLARRYDDARDGTNAERLYDAHAALVTELARAPLNKRVVDNAIARVASSLRDKNKLLGPKRQATYDRRLKELQADAKKQRSEAERGRIMVGVADLEGDIQRNARSR